MSNGSREFIVYPRSWVGDPAHLVVLKEIFHDKDSVEYSDFTELKELITEIEGRFNHNPKNFTKEKE
jgi:hypothetical protein